MIKTYNKHPLAVLDYGYNLARWLTGTEIVTSVNASLVSGDVVLGQAITDGSNMGVMISGGTNGTRSLVDLVGNTNSVPPRHFAQRFEIFVTTSAGPNRSV